MYLLGTDSLLEGITKEVRHLYYSLQGHAKLVSQLESEVRTWAQTHDHLMWMLHKSRTTTLEAMQKSDLDKAARAEAEKKLRKSEAEHRNMEK